MRRTSLSRQLIAGVLLAELLCAASFSAIAIAHDMHDLRRAFDVMLRGRADSLLGAVQDAEDPEDNVTVDPTELVLPRQDVYEVLNPSGRVLGHSPNSSTAQLAGLSSGGSAGYFNFRIGEVRYRALHLNGVRVIDREESGGIGIRRQVVVLYASPTRGLWHEAVEAERFYVVASALLLAITGAALVLFLRRRLSPLQELADIASQVSERSWDFVPPGAVLRTTELAPIAHSIDELLKGLRRAFERQRQLTGDAAHELKTSIAVLKSSLQLLSMNPRTTEQYEAGLEGLLVDTERMEDLACRMLALARFEEAPAEQDAASNLSESLCSVTERLRSLAELKQVPLTVKADAAAAVPLLREDAEVLCSNLILNALQHSSAGQRITASVNLPPGRAELCISDEGEGIPEVALPHVFDRFYRADSSRSRNRGGAGLGLSICKAIAERSGGTIRIESTPGAGTQVTVSLPLAPAAKAASKPGAPTGD